MLAFLFVHTPDFFLLHAFLSCDTIGVFFRKPITGYC